MAGSLTIYLFPIRNGSTEFNKDLNRQLGGLCEHYWDVNSSNLCQIGFFATIKRKAVLKRNFLNPKILEFQKSVFEDIKKETPTKKGQVKSILKSKRRDPHQDNSVPVSSSEAGTEHSEEDLRKTIP